jgi:4-carboxymuconolactone decarboxylase
MMSPHDLPEDIAQFRATYLALFGSVPPLPEGRFSFTSEVDPEFLRLAERLRAHAFYSNVFDAKTTQLMLFGMLLATGAGAARFHAVAARRAGATWEELQQVVALAAAAMAFGPANQGGAMLDELRRGEARASTKDDGA